VYGEGGIDVPPSGSVRIIQGSPIGTILSGNNLYCKDLTIFNALTYP
jgi:hypothetical protein